MVKMDAYACLVCVHVSFMSCLMFCHQLNHHIQYVSFELFLLTQLLLSFLLMHE